MNNLQTPSRLPVSTPRPTLGKRQLSQTAVDTAKRPRQKSATDLNSSTRTGVRMGPPMSTAARLTRQRSSSSLSTPAVRNTNAAAAPRAAGGSRPAMKELAIEPGKQKPGKRPAWDLKGRMQDMEVDIRSKNKQWEEMMTQQHNTNDRIAKLEQEKQQLEVGVKVSDQQKVIVETELSALRQQLSEQRAECAELQSKLGAANILQNGLQAQVLTLQGQLTAKSQEADALRVSLGQLTASQASAQAQLSAVQQLCAARDSELEQLRSRLAERETAVEQLEEQARSDESLRRRLHNAVQELKGNIRVFCRLRPVLSGEPQPTDGLIAVTSNQTLELKPHGTQMNESMTGLKKEAESKMSFSFDQVFPPPTSQTQVFEEMSQLIQSAMDGYNVCVFAYGQTGSGKTFTMEGGAADADDNCDKQEGMIPRAVRQIFQSRLALMDKGWKYEMDATFVEIYNETIRDLLNPAKETKPCEIRMSDSKTKEVYVTNLKTVRIDSEDDIVRLMTRARQQRAVAATRCNERSSRSHCVFTLKLTGQNSITTETCCGSLNLVDLAGSERVKESGSQGDRLTEAKSINKSLSNLGNVIMSLAQKQEHVPYRNSKLTHLLQHSLGGNSKTLMFVNVSPRDDCLPETINSLRFAAKVNQCHIGTATAASRRNK